METTDLKWRDTQKVLDNKLVNYLMKLALIDELKNQAKERRKKQQNNEKSAKQPKNEKSEKHCTYCGKVGHLVFKCQKKKNATKKDANQKKQNTTQAVIEVAQQKQPRFWQRH